MSKKKNRFNHYIKNFNNVPDYLWTNEDLKPIERDVMMIIYRIYGVMPTVKITQEVLCEAIKVSHPTMIAIFKKLEELKYIYRRKIPTSKGYTYQIIPIEKDNEVSIFQWLNSIYKKLDYDFRFHTTSKIVMYKNNKELHKLENEFKELTEEEIIQNIKQNLGKTEH